MPRKATQASKTPLAPPKRLANRKQLADRYYDRHGLVISPRTLERWPLRWKHVDGQAVAEVVEFDEVAQQRIDAAPVMMGGSKVDRAA